MNMKTNLLKVATLFTNLIADIAVIKGGKASATDKKARMISKVEEFDISLLDLVACNYEGLHGETKVMDVINAYYHFAHKGRGVEDLSKRIDNFVSQTVTLIIDLELVKCNDIAKEVVIKSDSQYIEEEVLKTEKELIVGRIEYVAEELQALNKALWEGYTAHGKKAKEQYELIDVALNEFKDNSKFFDLLAEYEADTIKKVNEYFSKATAKHKSTVKKYKAAIDFIIACSVNASKLNDELKGDLMDFLITTCDKHTKEIKINQVVSCVSGHFEDRIDIANHPKLNAEKVKEAEMNATVKDTMPTEIKRHFEELYVVFKGCDKGGDNKLVVAVKEFYANLSLECNSDYDKTLSNISGEVYSGEEKKSYSKDEKQNAFDACDYIFSEYPQFKTEEVEEPELTTEELDEVDAEAKEMIEELETKPVTDKVMGKRKEKKERKTGLDAMIDNGDEPEQPEEDQAVFTFDTEVEDEVELSTEAVALMDEIKAEKEEEEPTPEPIEEQTVTVTESTDKKVLAYLNFKEEATEAMSSYTVLSEGVFLKTEQGKAGQSLLNRSELMNLVKQLNEGDTLFINSVDSLRNMSLDQWMLVKNVLVSKNINIAVVDQPMTHDALMFDANTMLNEFIVSLINQFVIDADNMRSNAQKQGIKKAKENGKKLGRPVTKSMFVKRYEVLTMINDGGSWAAIKDASRCSTATIKRLKDKLKSGMTTEEIIFEGRDDLLAQYSEGVSLDVIIANCLENPKG